MGTITKRISSKGKLRYRAQVQIKGYPAQSKTFGHMKIAEKWIRDTEDAIRSGTHSALAEEERHSVADMINRFIIEEVGKRRSGHNTQRELEWFSTQIGNLRLSALTPAVVVECRTRLQQEESTRGKRSPATVNRYLAALSVCCSFALKEWMWIQSNPCSKVTRLQEAKGRTRFLSDEERQRLLKACEPISKSLYLAVILALSTGARRMNVWALTWNDIDLTTGKETVTFAKTKNDSTVILPLAGKVVQLLLDYRKVRRLDTNLLFPSRVNPNQPIDFKAPFAKALRQAEIEDFRWHDLRHSAASYLAQQGVDLRRIAAILGHKTLSMSLRYSHLNVEHLREDLEKMTGRL